MYEKCTKTVRIHVVTAEITAKNAAAEHFGHFSIKKWTEIVENLAWLACPKSGGCIFPGKKPPEAAYPGAHGFFVQQNPGWPAWHGFLARTNLGKTWFWY